MKRTLFILSIVVLSVSCNNVDVYDANNNLIREEWNSNGELEFESISEASDHVFDDDEKSMRQVITWKNMLKLENLEVVDNMVYDYAFEN